MNITNEMIERAEVAFEAIDGAGHSLAIQAALTAALQSAADTPAPVFASRHNDETGECEAVEVPPSGYQSIINRTIINRPIVTDEMIERACKAHNVGWSMWHEPQKRTARDVMRMALTAALRVSPLSPFKAKEE